MSKPIPTFHSDEEAEHFVDTADLSEYDLSGGQFVQFELRAKDKIISLRLPETMLAAVRDRAKTDGVPYQKFMRLAIERALIEPKLG